MPIESYSVKMWHKAMHILGRKTKHPCHVLQPKGPGFESNSLHLLYSFLDMILIVLGGRLVYAWVSAHGAEMFQGLQFLSFNSIPHSFTYLPIFIIRLGTHNVHPTSFLCYIPKYFTRSNIARFHTLSAQATFTTPQSPWLAGPAL